MGGGLWGGCGVFLWGFVLLLGVVVVGLWCGGVDVLVLGCGVFWFFLGFVGGDSFGRCSGGVEGWWLVVGGG